MAAWLLGVFAASPLWAQQKNATLTYTLPVGSRYTVKQDDRFPFKTNADGTVTARVLVTFVFLAPPPPDCYGSSYAPAELLTPETGLLGTERGFIPQSRDILPNEINNINNKGEIKSNTSEISAMADTLRTNGINLPVSVLNTKIDLFNQIRRLASRDDQDTLRQTAVGTTPTMETATTIANKDAAFAYGDWLANSRSARSLATNLFGVRVEWALEITFAPQKAPRFPIFASVKADVTKAPEQANVQPATSPAPATTGAAEAGGTTEAIGTLALASPLAGLGKPGADLVAGFTVLNDGTPTFAGLNLRPNNHEVSGKLMDRSRWGLLAGHTVIQTTPPAKALRSAWQFASQFPGSPKKTKTKTTLPCS